MSMEKKETDAASDLKYWSIPFIELAGILKSSENGLDAAEAENRLKQFGWNSIKTSNQQSSFGLFISQFKSPIIIILLFASVLSLFLKDITNSIIIFCIILVSGALSFWQEKGAKGAIAKLLAVVQIKTLVQRDGKKIEIPVSEVVPGEVIWLSAGDIVPGDAQLIHSTDLFVDEASLTGETFPVEKNIHTIESNATLSQRYNVVYMGTHVVSGSAMAMIVHTGKKTELGKVAQELSVLPPATEFEVGIRKFGYMLMEITLLLVLVIFAINIYFHRPVIDSLLFSLALAVGLTPQLLPAIISINLAHGAKNMAKSKVIVKKLSSIENFGSMNVLCSDKTGTLTEGEVKVKDFFNAKGDQSEKTLLYAYLNSFFETGFQNPMDKAIVSHASPDISSYKKTDEIPYDFIRKRLSILVQHEKSNVLITKGAFYNILEICKTVELEEGKQVPLEPMREDLQNRFEALSKQGYRVIGLAYKDATAQITKQSETDLVFLGFIVLFDPPKEGILDTIKELNELGVNLKIITGDNRYVTAQLASKIFSHTPVIVTGKELYEMSTQALLQQIDAIDIFAEVEPNQKEHILVLLKKKGNVVGYIGDGINDASALHVADVGISVDTAVDVAKESADIVLLEKNLNVLIAGVKEGRKTFANTMKYIFMATSANFGNMFSMAGISVFLPFLPLLPVQILLMNLLTDLPEMTIATDRVEEDQIAKPRRWNIGLVKRFMVVFGLLSSVFDFITFGILILLLHVSEIEFRTAWFMESVISASAIVLIVRTRKSIFKSRPGKYLAAAVVAIGIMAMALPYTELGRLMALTAIPSHDLLVIALIVLSYMASTELVKYCFYKIIREK
ncbi:MAG: Mg(2+) transport ATPase, P-type [Chitinophagaceae bacterium]|nr:Mg(2+) transport ATPase, P-type [Chitinophagaceae bacterium]